MAIKDEKQKIFGKIAALRTLNEGYPKFNLTNSFPSINNTDESIVFLIDLIIALLGSNELKHIATEFLTSKIGDLESNIKDSLKNNLNNKINMGTDPSIPTFLVNGFNLPIKNIDFFNQLKVDPKSGPGNQLYGDTNSGINSNDCNTFLYESLQDGNTKTWGLNSNLGFGLFDITPDNNDINIKVNNNYLLGGNTLKDFNIAFIDSITLFKTEQLVSYIIDKLFGTISNILNKTQDELLIEAKLNDIFESFINSDDDIVIDDSYFTFTHDQIRNQEDSAKNRSNGVLKLFDCGEYESSIPFDILTGITEDIKNTSTLSERKDVISVSLNLLGDYASNNASDIDRENVKSNFFKEFIKIIIITLISSILTPQLILLLIINCKLFESLGSENLSNTIDIIQFIKDNRSLFKSLICSIKNILINLLLSIIVKEIIKLTTAQMVNKEIESAKYKVLTMLSLMGVPQQILSVIRGL